MKESELIAGCLKEDAYYQRELFRRYAGKMLTVCLRYARHRMEAEDMLQEGFIRVFDNLHSFEQRGSLEGWIRRVVVNVALKSIGKLSFQREDLGIEGLPDSTTPPSVFSDLSEQELLKIIAKLPDGYRFVFNLHAIEGYSHREIADMLGIEESTSRSQLTKARVWLQNQIEKSQKITI